MKTPIYVITVDSGGLICVNQPDELFTIESRPFQSLLRTLWGYFSMSIDMGKENPTFAISYCGRNYRWDWDSPLVHECFIEGKLSEGEFAEAIMVKSKEEGK